MNSGGEGPLIWIPRPIEDAVTLADEVRTMGFTPLVEPVMTIRYLDTDPDMTGIAALVFTSANGVRAFTRTKPDRHLPVYAVGPQCAQTARDLGFTSVTVAGGDVEQLAATILSHHNTKDGDLLHIAASDLAGDLAGLLAESNVTLKRTVLYKAETCESLPSRVSELLQNGSLSAVMLFSPRTARTIESLIKNAGLAAKCDTVHTICLSQAVAGNLTPGQWASVTIAGDRNREGMLKCLGQFAGKSDDQAENSSNRPASGAKSQEKYATATASTPTLSTESKRTYQEGTAQQKKNEGAPGGMNAEHVIEQFGGIRPMAQKMGIAVSTVQGWKARNHIPENRWEDVRAAAEASGIELEEETIATDEEELAAEAEAHEEAQGSEEADEQTDAEETAESEVEQEESSEENTETETNADDAEEKADEAAAPSSDVSPASEPEKPEPAAAAPPPPLPAKPVKSGGAGWALFFALVALAGIATRGYWGPAVDPKVEAHLTNFFGPPVEQQASAVDETIQTDLVRTQEVIASMLKRVEDIEARAASLDGSLDGTEISSVAIDAVKDRVTALEDRLNTAPTISEDGSVDLEAMEAALAALRTRMGSLDGKADASIETFQLEIDTFGDRLAALGDDLASANTMLTSLGDRLRQIEEAPGNPTINSSAMVLAVGQLEIVADTGAPFADMLPGLTELAGDDAEANALIDQLKAASWEGVTTLSVLATQFGDIALLVDAAETSAVDGDWVDESLAALQSVVSVRRIDEAPDAPAASKAERALERGDLSTAVSLVSPFAEADGAISDWLGRANARLAVDTAITNLRARAVDRLRAMATTN